MATNGNLSAKQRFTITALSLVLCIAAVLAYAFRNGGDWKLGHDIDLTVNGEAEAYMDTLGSKLEEYSMLGAYFAQKAESYESMGLSEALDSIIVLQGVIQRNSEEASNLLRRLRSLKPDTPAALRVRVLDEIATYLANDEPMEGVISWGIAHDESRFRELLADLDDNKRDNNDLRERLRIALADNARKDALNATLTSERDNARAEGAKARAEATANAVLAAAEKSAKEEISARTAHLTDLSLSEVEFLPNGAKSRGDKKYRLADFKKRGGHIGFKVDILRTDTVREREVVLNIKMGTAEQPGFYHEAHPQKVKDGESFEMALPMPEGGFAVGHYFVGIMYKGKQIDKADFEIVR